MKKQERELTLGVAALAISLMAALFTFLQWWEARKTRIDVHSDAERARQVAVDQFNVQRTDAQAASQIQEGDVQRSANAADRSAKAAERSASLAGTALQVNRHLFEISERARVNVKGVDVYLKANEPIKAQLVFQNFGRTPANDLLVTTSLQFRTTPLPENPPDQPVREQSPNTLMPSDTQGASIVIESQASESAVEAVKAGKAYIYVFGHLEYKDVFLKPHKTSFCGKYNPADPAHLSMCVHNNGAD